MDFKDTLRDVIISLVTGAMFTVPGAYLVYTPSTGIALVDAMFHGASWGALTVLAGVCFIEIRNR